MGDMPVEITLKKTRAVEQVTVQLKKGGRGTEVKCRSSQRAVWQLTAVGHKLLMDTRRVSCLLSPGTLPGEQGVRSHRVVFRGGGLGAGAVGGGWYIVPKRVIGRPI